MTITSFGTQQKEFYNGLREISPGVMKDTWFKENPAGTEVLGGPGYQFVTGI